MDFGHILKSMQELEKLMGLSQEDFTKWVQVGTLSKEELGRRKGIDAKFAESRTEMDLLKKKLHAIRAELDVIQEEWWLNLKKTHGLPMEGEYHISEEGKILAPPKEANPSGE